MNIADILQQHARERANHPAIEDGERVIAYDELAARVEAAAANLHAAGIRSGDVVVIMLPDSANYLVVLYALAKLGAINFAVDIGLPKREREQATEGIAIKAMISEPRSAPLAGAKALNVSEICQFPSDAVAPLMASGAEFDGAQTLMIIRSSGTTGTPKQIPIYHAQIGARTFLNKKYTGIKASERYLAVVRLPFFAGSRRCMTMLQLGATVVINHAPSMAQLLSDFCEKNISYTYLSPGHIRPLLDAANGDGPMAPGLRIIVSTARLLPAERLEVRRRLTPDLIESYGSNEGGLMAVARPEDQDAYPDSVGRLIAEKEAEIVDDTDQPVPPGQVGNIRFRAQYIATTYLNNPEAAARAFRGGWFYPGDLAAINAAGYIFLKGRADDIINNEGAKFYPIELETVLASHPEVAEAAVIGWPHKRHGEVAVAFVVCRAKDLEKGELIEYCRERIAGHKLPHRIWNMRELPKNPMGKVVKNRLREHLGK